MRCDAARLAVARPDLRDPVAMAGDRIREPGCHDADDEVRPVAGLTARMDRAQPGAVRPGREDAAQRGQLRALGQDHVRLGVVRREDARESLAGGQHEPRLAQGVVAEHSQLGRAPDDDGARGGRASGGILLSPTAGAGIDAPAADRCGRQPDEQPRRRDEEDEFDQALDRHGLDRTRAGRVVVVERAPSDTHDAMSVHRRTPRRIGRSRPRS